MKLKPGIVFLPLILAATTVIVILSIFIYQTSVSKTGKPTNGCSTIDESEIDICEKDSDCIVVSYDHCCGSTKRAINKKYKILYFVKKDWQSFSGPCHLMGICPDDSEVTEAICKTHDGQMRCGLKY
jgi:hypothetical protein